MKNYLIRDWRSDTTVMVELSNEEISVLSHFLSWAELLDNFSISSMGDISHANWHNEYSIVEED